METDMTLYIDAVTKAQMEAICDQIGMTTSTALNLFAEAFVRTKGMPFPLTIPEIKGELIMPELCKFYNIVIEMIYSDDSQYHRPHFHVLYNEYEASVGVDGTLLAGSLPVKQLKLVQAWAVIHEDELYAAWNNAVRNMPIGKIDPLE